MSAGLVGVIRTGQGWSEQVKTGQNRSGKDKSGLVRAGQGV